MKVRTDFVTNSSSSSFTCVALYNKELYDFLQGLITDEKYKKQPEWAERLWWVQPETGLYQRFVWQELKFDRRCFKVQTTEELGNIDSDSISQYITSFFRSLDSKDKRNIRKLVSDVYKNDDYQVRVFRNLTDSYSGFDFKGFNLNEHVERELTNEKARILFDTIEQIAIDPETIDLSKKSIAINRDIINGFGIYDPDSERYRHIDKCILDKVKLGRLDQESYRKGLLYEGKRRKWGRFLRDFYKEAIEETGAIVLKNITGKSDFAVVFDSIDSVVNDDTIEQYLAKKNNVNIYDESIKYLIRGDVEAAREECYIDYLQKIIEDIDAANEKRGTKKPPVAVILESRLHDYLIKNTSLGNDNQKLVMKADGTIQSKNTGRRLPTKV